MTDATGEVVNWGVLEAAANNAQREEPLGVRLDRLQKLIDDGQVRQIGTNIVGPHTLTTEKEEETVATVVSYSILDGTTDINLVSTIENSYLHSVSVEGVCLVLNSTATNSRAADSEVINSDVHTSELRNTITESSQLNTTVLVGMEINGSIIEDTILAAETSLEKGYENYRVVITDGHIKDRRDFISFDDTIGTGNIVYAYQGNLGNTHVVAGCKDFDSVEAMLTYTRSNPPEYADVPEDRKAKYLQQIEAAAALIIATTDARDFEKAESIASES